MLVSVVFMRGPMQGMTFLEPTVSNFQPPSNQRLLPVASLLCYPLALRDADSSGAMNKFMLCFISTARTYNDAVRLAMKSKVLRLQ